MPKQGRREKRYWKQAAELKRSARRLITLPSPADRYPPPAVREMCRTRTCEDPKHLKADAPAASPVCVLRRHRGDAARPGVLAAGTPGAGKGDNAEDHLPPKASTYQAMQEILCYLVLWVLLSPCVLEKLKPPILHIKLDIFSPNVNLYLIVSLHLTLLL